MNNKIYYGEYTLEHWIQLILKGNIELPEYQRTFVWDDDDVKKLAKSLSENLFIPPVTIGAFQEGENTKNYIIDGQQRLTSLLLIYLDVFPEKNKFRNTLQSRIDENDDELNLEDSSSMEWRLSDIVKLGRDKQKILEVIKNSHQNKYKKLDCLNETEKEEFFKKKFLGFSYLVPSVRDNLQEKYYSSVFRDINISGIRLSSLEARESFYYLNPELCNFFNPEFSKNISVNRGYLDFVRCLAVLSEYAKKEKSDTIAQNFKKNMEEYYIEYIYSVINDSADKFKQFSTIFSSHEERNNRIDELKNAYDKLGFDKSYDTIIKLDMYFLGLVYFIVYKGKKLVLDNTDNKNVLIRKIEKDCNRFMNDPKHKKAPSDLRFLRMRIKQSIMAYKDFFKE